MIVTIAEDSPTCEGCGRKAVLKVNGFPVCHYCVDLPSEAGETPIVEELNSEN